MQPKMPQTRVSLSLHLLYCL